VQVDDSTHRAASPAPAMDWYTIVAERNRITRRTDLILSSQTASGSERD
jgi:hypothetical protein